MLNIGWCATEGGSKWIKEGDYKNEYAESFQLPQGATEHDHEIGMTFYSFGEL